MGDTEKRKRKYLLNFKLHQGQVQLDTIIISDNGATPNFVMVPLHRQLTVYSLTTKKH
jgi:hypothetical protein